MLAEYDLTTDFFDFLLFIYFIKAKTLVKRGLICSRSLAFKATLFISYSLLHVHDPKPACDFSNERSRRLIELLYAMASQQLGLNSPAVPVS